MGVLLGLIPIPIPGVGIVTLGIGGGPLIVALILGKLRPYRSNALDHAIAGQYRAAKFRSCHVSCHCRRQRRTAFCPDRVRVRTDDAVHRYVAVLLTTVFIVLLVGHYLMKIPYDDLVGVASGATGNPAILVYSTKMAPTERPRHRLCHDLSFDDAG